MEVSAGQPTVGSSERGNSAGSTASAVASDVATLGIGTLVAGLFNVAMVFVVPKLISVEDYGYWRMFGLYAGYVGFLHFGFVDGALLRWAGRPLSEFRDEIPVFAKYLLWQHVAVLVPLALLLNWFLPHQVRFVGVAVALYALLYNLMALLQFSLQAARIFRPVAISFVAAPALTFGFVILWRFFASSNYVEVISIYVLASSIPLLFLLVWIRPWKAERIRTGKNASGTNGSWACIVSGFPITLINTGTYLIQCADRWAISWAASIQDFAQYSLAASAIAVPLTAIQACSKVFFSHLASLEIEGRQRLYGLVSRSLLLVWTLLLPFYFLLEVVVTRFLPRFVPSLQYARVLLLAIPFLAAIQILQLSFAYLHGLQKALFVRTAVVLVITVGLMSLIALTTHSLRLMAILQVMIIAGWWLLNEWTLQDLTRQAVTDWMRFVSFFTVAGLAYWLTSRPGFAVSTSVPLYYTIVLGAAAIGCRQELSFFYKQLTGERALTLQL